MNEIKIQCQRSPIGEAIGSLSGIGTYGLEAFKGLAQQLNDDDQQALDFIGYLPMKGLELGEFMLCLDPLQPLNAFLDQLLALDDTEFLYYIFSEHFSRPLLDEVIEDVSILEKEIKKQGIYEQTPMPFIKELVEDLANSRLKLICGIQVAHRWNQAQEALTQPQMDKFIEETAGSLRRIAPLEYAQKLMGKKFRRISDYTDYLFIPTYYGGLNCIRFFNDDKLMVLDRVGPSWDSVSSETLAKAMKVMSDPTRLEIMAYITDRPSFGIELSERFGVSRPTISHHLDQMNSIGLVHMERVKNTKYYSLNKRRYAALLKELREYILKDQ
jgi:DNA-binding transcriptional ArsR family regulator